MKKYIQLSGGLVKKEHYFNPILKHPILSLPEPHGYSYTQLIAHMVMEKDKANA